MDYLQREVLSILAEYLSAVLGSMRQSKSTVEINMDQVALVQTAACFGVLDSAISVSSYNPENLLSFNSQVASLPDYVLEHFRIVSIIKPDRRLMLQAHLTSQGEITLTVSPD